MIGGYKSYREPAQSTALGATVYSEVVLRRSLETVGKSSGSKE